ncbi:glycosyltransferase family 4 protein [Rhodoplanes sp. Z2-YC6860]|uniref:glycosyltransferase family 4 protein n=1 Tax=Rhodoplanes sp. Z2-YC6860 TaxID=674703 RepID=UPI00078E4C79|nr:glycosyltransferase family 4 protein [Rhodoplanes sp. Z2-YC6860]AMN42255.1 glycosyl transferase, group 1 [Rhodoplanes sp. Z2-YC6860]
MSDGRPLRIVHVTRAPVGGIFRHILDLASGQAARGHAVGIITDSLTGGERAVTALAQLEPQLRLGVSRLPIQRELSPTDIFGFMKVRARLASLAPDVMHGHGAKGGAFVRMMSARSAIRVYTPHGGSLHYGRNTLRGTVYGSLERILMQRTELFLFESQFARNAYQAMVGAPPAIVHVVPNGITPAEMEKVAPRPDAADLLTVGEFRHIKGTDVLIEAVAELHKSGRKVTLAMAGDGEEGPALREQVAQLSLEASVRFLGHTPARQAFPNGRQMIVPSRADSLPYAVIEAGGAGIPIIASGVGGIPEILGPEGSMVPPGNPSQLAAAITAALGDPAKARAGADKLRERIGKLFSQDAMVEGVLAGYGEAIRAKKTAQV